MANLLSEQQNIQTINANEMEVFENENRKCDRIDSCCSAYLAAGYLILIAFICMFGYSVVQIVN